MTKVSFEDFVDRLISEYGYTVSVVVTNNYDGSEVYSATAYDGDSTCGLSRHIDKAIADDLQEIYDYQDEA